MMARVGTYVTSDDGPHPITAEIHVTQGLPGFTVLGLTDWRTPEIRDRLRAAFLSSEMQWPLRRVTVMLTPPPLSRQRPCWSSTDLAIAEGIAIASGQTDVADDPRRVVVGELGLDGSVRPVPNLAAVLDDISLRNEGVGYNRRLRVVIPARQPADDFARDDMPRITFAHELRQHLACRSNDG